MHAQGRMLGSTIKRPSRVGSQSRNDGLTPKDFIDTVAFVNKRSRLLQFAVMNAEVILDLVKRGTAGAATRRIGTTHSVRESIQRSCACPRRMKHILLIFWQPSSRGRPVGLVRLDANLVRHQGIASHQICV
jgi:hypothetical protein